MSLPTIDRLNYYNYFTEVEEEFVRRRGSHLLISPIDWALVETWKNAGVPLHIVLRGINQAFDGYDARGRTYRKVNSMLYCQQAVEESFAEYQLARVGGPANEGGNAREDATASGGCAGGEESGFNKAALLDFLDRCSRELMEAAERPGLAPLREGLDRALGRLSEVRHEVESSAPVDVESLERDLDSLDRMLLEIARRIFPDTEMDAIRKDAKAQLRRFRRTMDKAMYAQTIDNFVARRLREICCLPRLSLLYM